MAVVVKTIEPNCPYSLGFLPSEQMIIMTIGAAGFILLQCLQMPTIVSLLTLAIKCTCSALFIIVHVKQSSSNH